MLFKWPAKTWQYDAFVKVTNRKVE